MKDAEYVENMNKQIDHTLFSISKQKPDESWEMVKDTMINTSKKWSTKKAKCNKNELLVLTKKIEEYCEKLDNCDNISNRETYQNNIDRLKTRQDTHLTRIACGAMIRSRHKWYTEGESGSSYFMNLEKVKSSNKTIKSLILDDNTVLQNHKKILLAQFDFYKKLYSKNTEVYFEYTNKNNESAKVKDSDKELLDKPITEEEISNSIYSMSNNKTPGVDGLPIEIYKMFYGKIKHILYNAITYVVQKQMLHQSARRGILILIPKKNRPPEKLQNWRPLTMMSADQKILAKVLATRIKPILNYLIGSHQTGYLEGKFIGLNIRRLMDLLHYVEQENIEAILISVDFYKCFDTLEFQAIEGALRFFNFGDYFIQMVFTLYNNFETAILYSGHLSEYFSPQRGIHQGCPISGYLYILTAEILAINIKKNKDIKGIPIIGCKDPEVISQYVDDMYLLSMFDANSVEAIIRELQKFQENTGLTVNYEKTTMYHIGALKNSNRKLKTSASFKWSNADINVLGVVIDDDSVNTSYQEIISKMANITQIWSQRNLTIKGKTTVLNSLVGSLVVYQMQMLPLMSKIDIAKINRIVEEFIWNGRKPKIRLTTLQNTIQQGGVKLFNITLKDKSIKTSWAKRIQNFDPQSKHWLCTVYNQLFAIRKCGIVTRTLRIYIRYATHMGSGKML